MRKVHYFNLFSRHTYPIFLLFVKFFLDFIFLSPIWIIISESLNKIKKTGQKLDTGQILDISNFGKNLDCPGKYWTSGHPIYLFYLFIPIY